MSEPEMVERRGLVFRCGDYPAQKFSLTPEQFLAANAGLGEVPVGLDPIGLKHYHGKTSVLDGRTGSAAGFSLHGKEIHARFQVPDWLNKVVDECKLGMSAVFHRATGRLLKIDYTDSPVVADAALFAGGEPEPEEVAIFAEAEPAEDDDDRDLSKEDHAHHSHEILASGFPSLCDPHHKYPDGHRPDHLIALHDFHVYHGAQCSGMGHAGFAQEDCPVAEDQTDIDTVALFARLEALEADNKRLSTVNEQVVADNTRSKADLAVIKAGKIAAEAVGFAKDHADKLPVPAQAAFTALFQALASDDDAHAAEVGFSHGSETFKGSRIDLLKKAVAALQPHGIAGARTLNQRVAAPPARDGVVLFSDVADPAELTDADKKRLDRMAAAV